MRTCQLIFLSRRSKPVTLSGRSTGTNCFLAPSPQGRDLSIKEKKLQLLKWWHHIKASVEQDHLRAAWAYGLGDPRDRQVWMLGPHEKVWVLGPCFPGAGTKGQLITALFPCLFYGDSVDLLVFLWIKDWSRVLQILKSSGDTAPARSLKSSL